MNIDYTPNSNKFKKEQRSQEKVQPEKVSKGVVKTQKNEHVKLSDVFISSDISNVKDYVLMDVLIPAIKKAVCDIVSDGIHMILYGNTAKRDSKYKADKVSYDRYYSRDKREEVRPASKSRYSYEDVFFTSRGEAEEKLEQLCDALDTYGVVTVSDLYDLVGKTGEYTDEKYGWTNLSTAKPVRVADGYILQLPKALPIHR